MPLGQRQVAQWLFQVGRAVARGSSAWKAATALAAVIGQDGRLDPTKGWIAEKIDLCEKTVERALAKLAALGFLTWHRRVADERQTSNAYQLQFPPSPESTEAPEQLSTTPLESLSVDREESIFLEKNLCDISLPNGLLTSQAEPAENRPVGGATALTEIHVRDGSQLTQVCQEIIRGMNRDLTPSPLIDEALVSVDALMQDAKASAFAWITNESGVVRPAIRFYRRAGKVAEIIIPEFNDEDQIGEARLAAAVAVVLEVARIDGYFVTGEAWVAKYGDDKSFDGIKPSERESRQEVLVVAGGFPGNHTLRLYPIERGPDGTCSGFGKPLPNQNIQFTNPMMSDLYAVGDQL
jgi:hypothetical protein